jgi:hypothetical protein
VLDNVDGVASVFGMQEKELEHESGLEIEMILTADGGRPGKQGGMTLLTAL